MSEGHQLGRCHGYREIFFEVVENLAVGNLSFSVGAPYLEVRPSSDGIEITMQNSPPRALQSSICQFLHR